MRNVYADLLLTLMTLTYIEANGSKHSQGISDYQSYLNDDNEYGNLGPPIVRKPPVQGSQAHFAAYPRSTNGAGTSFAEYMKNDDDGHPSLGRYQSQSPSQQNNFDVRSAPVVGSSRSQPGLAPSAQSPRGTGASFADYMKDDDDGQQKSNRAYGQPSAPQSSFDVRNAPIVGSQDSQSDFVPSSQRTGNSGISFADYMRDNDGWQNDIHAAHTQPATARNNFDIRTAPVVGSQSSQPDFAVARQPSWPAPEQRSWSGSGNDRPRSEWNWSNRQSSSYWVYLHSKEETGRKQHHKAHNSDGSKPRCVPGNAVWPTICRSRNEDPVFYHGPFGVQRIVTSRAAWDKR